VLHIHLHYRIKERKKKSILRPPTCRVRAQLKENGACESELCTQHPCVGAFDGGNIALGNTHSSTTAEVAGRSVTQRERRLSIKTKRENR
jgi:hypothetical protein